MFNPVFVVKSSQELHFRLINPHLWLLLLTWFNFNPSMDKLSHAW